MTTIITILLGLAFSCLDPEHQRAKGNRKYFEFQLEKQKKAEESESLVKKDRGTRETGQKKKSRKNITNQLLPERKKYEMLCRGEGIKMVRKTKETHTSYFQFRPPLQLLSLSLVRPPEGRADCSVVTLTTITTPDLCWHLPNSKMSGTAPTLSATWTSFQTSKWIGSSSWQSQE